ncbi:MAG: c-type cytochrome [Verrucomicrobiota bacterium]
MKTVSLALGAAIALATPTLAVNPDSYNLDEQGWDPDTTFPILSPEEAIKTIEVPEGYHLEVVASEPMVEEPAMIAFGPDGALYVCEWRTYMQDEYATDQLDPVSRIVKLIDTDNDGKMDKRTVFIDNVILPRSVLPLADRVLVNLTNSNTIYAYFDDNNDGVADRREVAYEGEPNKGNVEHQASGLVYNLDNYIYGNYHRYRYDDGKLIATPHNVARISQWGLARDDDGRIYCSWAGGGNPAHSFQFPGGYPVVNIKEHADGYEMPYASCKVWDQSSGGYKEEEQIVLKKHSASCGQSILRSPLFPQWYVNVVTCEPVGRFIRMTNIEWDNGKGTAHNTFQDSESEFIRSTDAYFRPVWTESGPDGCLYIADMYRGIIQEKQWFPTEEGDIRTAWVNRYKRVKKWGMLDAYRHGRIYRLVPDDFTPNPQPHMSQESGATLAVHLKNPNGWWRDTAQKLIVTGQKDDAIPALNKLAAQTKDVNARITALWSLEGLDALTPKHVLAALDAKEPRVRRAAVQLSEAYLKESHTPIRETLVAMLDDPDHKVRIQLYLSFNKDTDPDFAAIREELEQAHLTDHPLVGAIKHNERKALAAATLSKSALSGMKIYESLCNTCHGFDGKGAKEGDHLLAPPLVGNDWFKKRKPRIDIIARILLKGQMGPIDGVTYGEGIMVPLELAYKDAQLANVINYVGESFNKWPDGKVKGGDIAKVREQIKDRVVPWTQEELKALPAPK